MHKIPAVFYRVMTQVVYFVVVPVFFLCFALLYRPLPWLELFGVGSLGYSVNAILIMCIMMAVMAVSRMLIFILRKHLNLNWVFFISWSLAELVLVSFFVGLYVTLMSHGGYSYFSACGHSFVCLLMSNIFPLLIITLIYERYAVSIEPATDSEQLIRFADSNGKLRVIVTSDNLLYIEAKENYVKVSYLEGERVTDYMLHNTMRAMETLLAKHGIVRCQRSYFVNPKHVAVLRKEKDGMIVAQLDIDKLQPIPVSPKYYDNLAMLL